MAGIHEIGTSNVPVENTEQNGAQRENPKLKMTEWEKGDTQDVRMADGTDEQE